MFLKVQNDKKQISYKRAQEYMKPEIEKKKIKKIKLHSS